MSGPLHAEPSKTPHSGVSGSPLSSTTMLVTLQHGRHVHRFRLPLWAYYAGLVIMPLSLVAALVASCWLAFHDDLVSMLVAREHTLITSYEDRIYSLQSTLDSLTSKSVVAQDSVQSRLQALSLRQAKLEDRSYQIAALSQQLQQILGPKPGKALAANGTKALTPLLQMGRGAGDTLNALGRVTTPLGDDVESYTTGSIPTPDKPAAPKPRVEKPRVEAVDLPSTDMKSASTAAKPASPPQTDPFGVDLSLALRRNLDPSDPVPAQTSPGVPPTTPSQDSSRPDSAAHVESAPLSVAAQTALAGVAVSLDGTETRQIQLVGQLHQIARERAERLRRGFVRAGVDPAEIKLPPTPEKMPMGGPFVPLRVDPARSPFDRELAGLQTDMEKVDHLNQMVAHVPLAQPVPGELDMTSPFGGRPDPFTGRMAMHSGMDFRQEYGSPIMATAAGKVVTAGPSGGYGNMVEIDHGNGLSTRYGHLSAILVREGQSVQAGTILGQAGSTGRSTGTHLHYEVRVDGEAVDPSRFLDAGRGLLATN